MNDSVKSILIPIPFMIQNVEIFFFIINVSIKHKADNKNVKIIWLPQRMDIWAWSNASLKFSNHKFLNANERCVQNFMLGKMVKSLLSRFIFITSQLILFNVADAYRMQQFATPDAKMSKMSANSAHICWFSFFPINTQRY